MANPHDVLHASMRTESRQQAEVRIFLRKETNGRKLHGHSEGPAEQRKPVEPLVDFLRKQRPWPGQGEIVINIGRPEVVERAFTVPGAVTNYYRFELEAELEWLLPQFWRGGISYLVEWQAKVTAALNERLVLRARLPQSDLFASQRKDK